MMKQLEERLQSLKAEFEVGQKRLQTLDDEAQKVRHTLLRISGGIQVLEEELAKTTSPSDAPSP